MKTLVMISLAGIFFLLKSIQKKHLQWYILNKTTYLYFYSISITKTVGATPISSISPQSQRPLGSPKFKTPCITNIPKSLVHFWSSPVSGAAPLTMGKATTWTTQMFPIWRMRKPVCLHFLLALRDPGNLFSSVLPPHDQHIPGSQPL